MDCELDAVQEAALVDRLRARLLPFTTNPQVDGLDRERGIGVITQDGREDVGWVPREAEVGDQLCLMAGAPYPFVLRPLKNGHHTILGDAYIAKTTLVEALGGEVDRTLRKNDFGVSVQLCMDWNDDSAEMRRLVDGLGVLTLE